MFVLPKIHMLKPQPQEDGIKRWGPWEVTRSWGWSLHEWDQCPYKPTPESSLAPLLSHEDTVRIWPSMNQEVGPHQTSNLPALILDFQPPEL